MATNYYGHVVLNRLLMDLVEEAGKRSEDFARIILVSSVALIYSELEKHAQDFDLDKKEVEIFDPMQQYSDSKLAQVLYTAKLAEIFNNGKKNIAVTAIHPGKYFVLI